MGWLDGIGVIKVIFQLPPPMAKPGHLRLLCFYDCEAHREVSKHPVLDIIIEITP